MSYWKKKCKHCPIKIHAPQYWKADMESSKRFAFSLVHETSTYFFYLICWRWGTRSRRRSAKCIIEHWTSITNLALILQTLILLIRWNFWPIRSQNYEKFSTAHSQRAAGQNRKKTQVKKRFVFHIELFLFDVITESTQSMQAQSFWYVAYNSLQNQTF